MDINQAMEMMSESGRITYRGKMELRKHEVDKDGWNWEKVWNNKWYKWVYYTTAELDKTNFMLCTLSPLTKLFILPNPNTYEECAGFERQFCHLPRAMQAVGTKLN